MAIASSQATIADDYVEGFTAKVLRKMAIHQARIEECQREIEKLEKQIEQTKEEATQLSVMAYGALPDARCVDLAAQIYWLYAELVPPGITLGALNIGADSANEYIGKSYFYITCIRCERPMRIYTDSYVEMRRIQFEVENGSASDRHLWCSNCKDIDNEETLRRQRDLHTMSYGLYLLTPEWRITRIRKLEQAQYRCELCNAAGKLNVHHKTYERRGYEDDKDLIVLCEPCHAKFHDKLPSAE